MKPPDFGDVLKIDKWEFFRFLNKIQNVYIETP
jgi:hypothetical protein